MASAVARAYMGSGGLPPVGSRGKAPGQGVWGTKSPLKLTRFCIFKFIFLMKNAPILRNLNRSHHAENMISIYIMPIHAYYACLLVSLALTNNYRHPASDIMLFNAVETLL